jgi:ribonuclease Z
MERFGPSILVETGDKKYVFDVGRGAIQRLTELGIAYDQIDGVFFTHLHSDHVVGFPDLWLTGWLLSRRDRPLNVFGPVGTQRMLEHLTEAYSFDIELRITDDGVPPSGSQFKVTEVVDGFEIADEGVIIRAFDVDHRPIDPALGFRIDVGQRSVALSGDTRYSQSLIEAVAGVDVLIHEVIAMSEAFAARRPWVVAHHTTAVEAGRIFSQVSPALAVYTHVITDQSLAEIEERTRTTYDGPLVIGEDLMSFDIGEEVRVRRR